VAANIDSLTPPLPGCTASEQRQTDAVEPRMQYEEPRRKREEDYSASAEPTQPETTKEEKPMATAVALDEETTRSADTAAIRPFKVHVPEAELTELRRRVHSRSRGRPDPRYIRRVVCPGRHIIGSAPI
jgi:hypothetical protein